MADRSLTTRGEATRRRIIEATGEQLLEAGIGGTSLDGIRAATLTSKSQLFHYFPGGKHELLLEVARWEGAQLFNAQRPHLDDLSTAASWRAWRDALVGYYIGLGRWACPIGSLVQEAAHADAALSRDLAEQLGAWQAALAAGVRRLRDAGGLPGDAPPERLATAVLAALQGGLLLSTAARSPEPLQAALDTVLDLLGVRG